ncbi:MAG: hypothetical protein A3F70_10920 [Acidobacteria bacterium RIFCSPLOWO2_12_FULL_67_14]|nr:MAG: hypothetical protein A3H29_05530 [Acidobacteria bacterium RIFCSPLOWO2_02_FULL_67_21]OFW39335.1 MAG: hypothetical protein A3F70_10920 [Acidobacteria bacterium RIFCSPLOWO2_12_FULL_67_14]
MPALAAAVLLAASPAAAQTNDVQALRQEVEQLRTELASLQRQYADRLAALEARLGAAQGAPAVPAVPPVAEVPAGAAGAGPAGPLPVYGAPTAGSKIFNPDIGMIGNFLGAVGSNQGGSETIAPTPFMTLQESEASFQAIVDPYARADFFLAVGEEGIEVEEGYVTFPTLPGGLLVKAGKMRANFGRLNAFHNHSLPWIDRPLVMYNLLGGSPDEPDTGIKDAGVSVNRLIPAGSLFLEATGEIYRGDSGTLFKTARLRDFAALGRVRGYVDLSDDANLETGVSYTRGHNDLGSGFITELYGTDLTFRWRPLSRAIYRSLAARAELVWSRRQEAPSLQRAFGFYGSLEYQLQRRWFVGGRFDQAERALNAAVRDRGVSTMLTYWPSEFSQIRGQYRRTRYGDDRRVANELLFQLLFTIGAHGAHPF